MNSELIQKAEKLFDALIELPAEERGAALDRECVDAPDLRAFVSRLLKRHDDGIGDFLATPIINDSMAESIPRRIGRYRVIRKIGEGGMGVVYEAQQESPLRTVALKVIRMGFASRAMLRRFQHEAEILGRLQHPGIATIHEAGMASVHADGSGSKQPFFAMEFVEGRPITKFAEEAHLNDHQRLALIAEVCDAIQHAHLKGIVHRDLKPGNILVTTEQGSMARSAAHSQPGRPKILDFGVARLTEFDVQTATMHTRTGELVGTLPYMSPEQVSGDTRDLDTRSDVYAVGVVLYELLADRLPYDVGKRPVVEAARVIRDEEPTRLSMIKSRLRGDVEIIVGKALEKDRDRRYQTAAELAADIRRYLSDTPIVARRPSTFYQARKFAKRHKGIVGGLGAAFLALAIGLGAALHQADEARLEARRADENKLQADEQARMAKVEADRATRRLNEVRALARAFIFDFHNEIADLPGSLPAREFLVRTALSYLNSLSAEIDDDPGFRRELALAYRQIGNLQGNPYQPNINDVEGACKSLGMSLTLLRQNAEVDPTDFHTQLDIAQTEYLLGDVLVSQRRIEEALRRYQSAADIGESLLAEDSSNRSLLSTMNVVHDRFGTLLLKLGRREEALKQRTASLKVAEQVYALDPGSIVYRANIAISRQSVARMLCDLGRQDEARAYHERAVAVFEDLAADHPGHARVLRSLIWTLSNFGQFLKDRGEFEESARVLRNAAAHAEQMIENDPLDSVAKQSLRTLYSSLAQLMNLRDRPAEALDNARKALALAESIYSTDPVNQAAAEDYAVSGVAVGQMLRRSGQSEESLPYVHRGLATLESHSRKNPMDLEVMFKLSVGLGELGHALLDLQRLQEAEALYGEKLAVSERLAAQNGGDVRCARDRANALFMLGEVHERMAEDDSLTRDHRLQFIHSARSGYQDAKAIFMELEKNQRALQQDVPLLHQTDKSIERCDRLLQELRRDPPGGEL